MSVSGVAVTRAYFAYDATTGLGKTGDSGNHTLRIVADGTEATLAGAAAEVDATNAPGVYKLALTAGENTGTAMALAGKSSTANVVLVPTQWDNTAVAVATPPTAAAIGTDAASKVLATPANKLVTDAAGAVTVTNAVPLADITAAILLDPTHPLATNAAGAVTAANAVVEADLLAGIEAGTVAGVTGDVDGKVLGGGSGTITGIGSWCAGAGGAAVALASKLLTFVQSLARKDVAADAEIAGTFASATDSLEAQADALAVALPGDGAFPITLTAKVDGVATLGVRIRLEASGGSTYQDSTADGTVHFNRDAAASPGLWCRVAGNGLWEDFTVQVVISPTGVVTAPVGGVLALVGIDLPAATDPTRCRCYLDMLQAGADAAVGATLGKLAVTGINTRPAGDTHVYSCDEMADDTGGYTDANGRAYLDIPRGMVCWVQATYPDTGDVTKQITVPAAASYDIGVVFPGYVAAP
jgi:hypothetical protein